MRAAPPPVLDRRDDEQILGQLRKLAARLVPEWKGDPNAKPDAGTMLHRIFTRLMEITLERLNKAPGMNLYAFLNAVGVSLLPPVPARVPLTFSLTSGSAPVLVPQGTRASTTPKGGQQPVDFETTADLTVVPAALVAAWTMDPGWDRSAGHSALIDGSSGIGFTPLLGASRLSHALFLGDERLLDFNRAEVTVTSDGPNSQEVKNQFRGIVWQYVSNGHAINLAGNISATANQITFEAVNALDQTILKGPSDSASLRRGLRSHWLHAALPRPLAEDDGAESLTLKNLRLSVSGKGILPDFAFANAVPLDVTMPFHPFGEAPKIGDAFCLTCSEALAKPNARLTLSFVCKATPQEASLQWEFFGTAGWTKFDSAQDETASLSNSGNVVLKLADLILGKINGKDGLWIRVRIASGDYGKPAEYVEIDPERSLQRLQVKRRHGQPRSAARCNADVELPGRRHSPVGSHPKWFPVDGPNRREWERFQPFCRGPKIDAPHLRRHRAFPLPRFRQSVSRRANDPLLRRRTPGVFGKTNQRAGGGCASAIGSALGALGVF